MTAGGKAADSKQIMYSSADQVKGGTEVFGSTKVARCNVPRRRLSQINRLTRDLGRGNVTGMKIRMRTLQSATSHNAKSKKGEGYGPHDLIRLGSVIQRGQSNDVVRFIDCSFEAAGCARLHSLGVNAQRGESNANFGRGMPLAHLIGYLYRNSTRPIPSFAAGMPCVTCNLAFGALQESRFRKQSTQFRKRFVSLQVIPNSNKKTSQWFSRR
ncbi:hypothetical protein P175DRAFT_0528423 [Aspergillus ochraceoroseus IBT 24754]|uniref:Uncharacterized protein n=1 Tax=Aspergillus ochraceoroseus IBT 24754 TaxID=1392256 RepID=A0A2T5M8Q4_9EURO|nr:uncharacterized protein P175DRAFT_0528423 [Aspergillus ochraceoroseus IBT 24754]PTU24907.1 hypothetical protein P175DRAFT_0528423 [Aspergillus ochraceoroseus IBT 24754]